MIRNDFTERDYLRFLDRLLDPSICWPWGGAHNHGGYSQFSIRSAAVSGHRTSFEMFIGPIPEGLEIDHLCNNPSCVNPHHLRAVTQRENWERSSSFTALQARQTHCKRGHFLDEDNTLIVTRSSGKKSRICRACARERSRKYRKSRSLDVVAEG